MHLRACLLDQNLVRAERGCECGSVITMGLFPISSYCLQLGIHNSNQVTLEPQSADIDLFQTLQPRHFAFRKSWVIAASHLFIAAQHQQTGDNVRKHKH